MPFIKEWHVATILCLFLQFSLSYIKIYDDFLTPPLFSNCITHFTFLCVRSYFLPHNCFQIFWHQFMDNFWCFSDAEISLPTARETGRRFVNSIVFLSYLKVDGIQKKTKSYFPNWLTDWECAVVTFKTSAIDLNGFSLEQRLVRPCYSRYLKIPRSLHGHLLKKDHNVALV